MAERRAHHFAPLAGLPWPVCTTCGLVRLKNALTAWAIRHGCDHAEHPQYRAAVRALSAPEDHR